MTKRDAICDAALELFAEQGIEATTIREIAERADAAEGTLYRHFGGKGDLAAWLYQHCSAELETRLEDATRGASTPSERLEGLVRGIFVFFNERPTSCTYLLDADADPREGRRRSDGPRHGPLPLFVEVLEEGMDRGLFRSDSAPLIAGWILSMVQHTVSALKTGGHAMDERDAIARTVDAVRRITAVNAS